MISSLLLHGPSTLMIPPSIMSKIELIVAGICRPICSIIDCKGTLGHPIWLWEQIKRGDGSVKCVRDEGFVWIYTNTHMMTPLPQLPSHLVCTVASLHLLSQGLWMEKKHHFWREDEIDLDLCCQVVNYSSYPVSESDLGLNTIWNL